jgi:hypothetical protein
VSAPRGAEPSATLDRFLALRSDPAGTRRALAILAGPAAPPRSVLGWGTVDAERLAATWSATLRALPADEQLGARAWLIADGLPAEAGERTILLEPSTEGRLAATLARFGEGPAALYVRTPLAPRALRAAGLVLATARAGPLGRQALVVDEGRFGPHLVAVLPGMAVTIRA